MAGTSLSEHRGTDVSGRRLRRMPTRTHAVLLLAGTGTGIVAAVYAYARAPSWLLAVVVFGLVCDTIGRSLAGVLAAEHKLRQAGYAALLPGASALFVSAFYLAWGQLDLAVLLGLAGGLVVQTAFSPALAAPLPLGRDVDSVDPGRAAPGS